MGLDCGWKAVNSFFETSKKTSKKRRLGRFVRGLRDHFNHLLILGVSAMIVVAYLYLFVTKQFEGDLGRIYPELAENSYVYDEDGHKIKEFPIRRAARPWVSKASEIACAGRWSPSRTGVSTTTGGSTP